MALVYTINIYAREIYIYIYVYICIHICLHISDIIYFCVVCERLVFLRADGK